MLLVIVFVVGYLAIVLEQTLRLNKAAAALLTGIACWVVVGPSAELGHHLSDIAQIVFFLLGAMAIVETIDAHDGFDVLTSRVTTTNRRALFVVIATIAFFLSAVLDNLTTAIVMISLVRKLVKEPGDRMRYAGVVVIAANAGGVFSPIGDVTTTMLWIGGQITAAKVMTRLFLPAVVSVAVPLLYFVARAKGNVTRAEQPAATGSATTPLDRKIVFGVGAGSLLFVPVFKTLTHLPPMLGVLLGLGVLWTVTEILHKRKDHGAPLSVSAALQRIDTPSVLFFLGILLAVSALETSGHLRSLATVLERAIGNVDLVTIAIGLASSVVDNVPLVAAAQGMYPLATYPPDHRFWLFLAYCAGTGGSILVIGSAAGVAVMGMERITFGAYLRRISLPALIGYIAGAAAFALG